MNWVDVLVISGGGTYVAYTAVQWYLGGQKRKRLLRAQEYAPPKRAKLLLRVTPEGFVWEGDPEHAAQCLRMPSHTHGELVAHVRDGQMQVMGSMTTDGFRGFSRQTLTFLYPDRDGIFEEGDELHIDVHPDHAPEWYWAEMATYE